jgi:diguanylate cyclase (GGDEF)-like protein
MSTKDFGSKLVALKFLISEMQTELAHLERETQEFLHRFEGVQKLADRDSLTGCLRREAFFREVTKWPIDRSADVLGVILLDLDHFKSINDSFGHSRGDQVLQQVGILLQEYQSQGLLVGRLGGEEFVLAYRGSSETLQRISEDLRVRVQTLPAPYACTASLGVAWTLPGEKDFTQILEAADEALYVAKRNGRNQVRVA